METITISILANVESHIWNNQTGYQLMQEGGREVDARFQRTNDSKILMYKQANYVILTQTQLNIHKGIRFI